ncbi:MAG: hypothetical protein IJP49_00600 [Bacteroidales bacterium]|nr:hypothetical protein [Bacteroidales bacterium]
MEPLMMDWDPRTDCHCHILPGLDDGAASLEEAVFLAGKQAEWGFRKVVCTSHRVGKYPNVPDSVITACRNLQEELRKRSIPLELIPSMEYRLIPETWPETLEKGWLLPWEGNHILIELPIHKASRIGNIIPEDEIKRLLDRGYQPVLAHPERYLYLDPDRYRSLKEAGALFQRNIGSLEGLYGDAVSARAESLAAEGFYDMQGTDLHNARYAAFFDSFGFRV